MIQNIVAALMLLLAVNCNSRPDAISLAITETVSKKNGVGHTPFDSSIKTIHVLAALCDNKYQGIVPVPAKIGNGQDPGNNLYWGCAFGIRSYFKNSSKWQLLKQYNIDSIKMERLVFKHKTSGYYLVADAYNGKNIKDCTVDFLKSCSGQFKDTLQINSKTIGINGNAKLVSYIGHDGLMDFSLTQKFNNTDGQTRDAIILACYSKRFFSPHLLPTKARPLLWSSHLMSPEAYTLHDAIESYLQQQPVQNIRHSAVKAYAKYQRCSEKAAAGLLVSGY